jgi:hypothetical protein
VYPGYEILFTLFVWQVTAFGIVQARAPKPYAAIYLLFFFDTITVVASLISSSTWRVVWAAGTFILVVYIDSGSSVREVVSKSCQILVAAMGVALLLNGGVAN